jgi:hypothetical protein
MKIKMENEFMLSSPDGEATSRGLVYLPTILDAWRKIVATPGDLVDVLVHLESGILSDNDGTSYSNAEPPAE